MKVSLVSYYSDTLIIDQSKHYDTVFLIDVYRATSTMVVMATNKAKAIKPVASIDEAFYLREQDPSVVLCGERNSIKPEGFDYGNDPSLLHQVDLTNKTCVMTTSNGTKAMRAFENTSTTFIACSFLNIDACIKKIQQSDDKHILVLCAGNWGKFSMEDYLCATMLLNGIKNEITNMNDEIKLAIEVGEVYEKNPEKLKKTLQNTDHAQKLKSQNKYDDVCFIIDNINATNCLPQLQL
ncbi:MAG: 2-phosphosulfolactate phosphatase [Thermotogota bacterium]